MMLHYIIEIKDQIVCYFCVMNGDRAMAANRWEYPISRTHVCDHIEVQVGSNTSRDKYTLFYEHLNLFRGEWYRVYRSPTIRIPFFAFLNQRV